MRPHPPHWTPESYADLELIQSVHKSYLRNTTEADHFRITAPNVLNLQRYLTRYFGRPNAYDKDVDRAPRAGIYQCAQCFYFDGRVTAVTLQEGDNFPACSACGDGKWLPNIRSMTG